VLLLLVFQALLELVLELVDHEGVVVVGFGLRVVLLTSYLVNGLLELLGGFFQVFLVLVTLLLEELVLAFPQCGLLVELVHFVLQFRFEFVNSPLVLLPLLVVSTSLLTYRVLQCLVGLTKLEVVVFQVSLS